MAHEATARDPLYPGLARAVGEEVAMQVLDRLPPPGHEPATRTDMRELEQRMDRLEHRMDRLERLMERFDDRLHGFHEGLRDQTRIIMYANAAMLLTLATILLAAGALN